MGDDLSDVSESAIYADEASPNHFKNHQAMEPSNVLDERKAIDHMHPITTKLDDDIEMQPNCDLESSEASTKNSLTSTSDSSAKIEAHSDSDPHALLSLLGPGDHYYDACRLTIRLGQAAMKYGSTTDRVEIFLTYLMKSTFGYPGCIFRVSHMDIMCSFQRTEDSLGHSQFVTYESNPSLHKLGLTAELAKDLALARISMEEANQRLDEIDQEKDVYGWKFQLVAFVAAGGGLAMVYRGSWANIALGAFNGAIVYALMIGFEACTDRIRQWAALVSSFVCSAFVTTVKTFFLPEINVALVCMAGLAYYLPGYSITLGTSELVSNHVLSGMAHLIQGIVIMMYLILGTWVGRTTIQGIHPVSSLEENTPSVDQAWLALFVPLLFIAITIIFQNSHRDVPWSILCMAVAYGTTVISLAVTERTHIATFVSSVAMVMFSNIWARWQNRPSTIILMPALLLKVSGSIGYLGIMQLVDGNSFVGIQQFISMFFIALLIIVGVLVGNTLVPINTTI